MGLAPSGSFAQPRSHLPLAYLPPPRNLVICHQQLGDLTLLEPAISRIWAATGAPVDLLTRGGHGPLVTLMKGCQMERRPWFKSYDTVYCFGEYPKTALHAALVPARRKVLVLRKPEEKTRLHKLVFHQIHADGLEDEYVARYNWEQTPAGRDQSLVFRPPALHLPPEAWRPEIAPEEDFVLLNATAGWASKLWKIEGWVKVLTRLQKAGLPRVLVTCGTEDWQMEHARQIAEGLGEGALFLGGATSAQAYLWLVARSQMVLGIDGSAYHLKAAFGGKSLTLFLRTSAANWHHPTARSVALSGKITPGQKGSRLDVEQVIEAALQLWREPEAVAT